MRGIWLFGFVILAAFTVDSAVSTWSTVYLQDELLAAAALAPLGYAAYQAAILLTRLLTDRATGRFGRRAGRDRRDASCRSSAASSSRCCRSPAAAIVGFALAGVAVGALVPLAFTSAGGLAPARSDEIIARVNLFNYVGARAGRRAARSAGGRPRSRHRVPAAGRAARSACCSSRGGSARRWPPTPRCVSVAADGEARGIRRSLTCDSEPEERAGSAPARAAAAAQAAREEETLRERWEATQESFRERFDAAHPDARRSSRRRRWPGSRSGCGGTSCINNGFLLGAGISYQALFAIFAAIYVAFAITGLWLGGNDDAVNAMIALINSYIPGLIGDNGVVTPEQVQQIASSTTGVLGVTGLIALGAVIWTAIGWVTYSRRGVRDIFGIPPDRRSYVLLKARDLLAAIIFGVALHRRRAADLDQLVGARRWVLSLIGVDSGPVLLNSSIRIGSVIVSFAINSGGAGRAVPLPHRHVAALARDLARRAARRRRADRAAARCRPAAELHARPTRCSRRSRSSSGCCCGSRSAASSCWSPPRGSRWRRRTRTSRSCCPTEAERIAAEHKALLLAAQVRLRTAREARAAAPWYRAWRADLARARGGGRAGAGRGVGPGAARYRRRRPPKQAQEAAAGSSAATHRGACQGRSIGWQACRNASASPRSTSTGSARRSATA